VYYLASRIQTELLNIAYRHQVVVELKCPIFWETESIRIDSNCELECTTGQMSAPPASAARRRGGRGKWGVGVRRRTLERIRARPWSCGLGHWRL